MRGKVLLIGLLALAIALSGCVEPVEPTACTEDSRLCPDGSSVSRNPALDCEFDPCPAASCDTSCNDDSDCAFTCETTGCVNKGDFECLGTEMTCPRPPGECECIRDQCEFVSLLCVGEGVEFSGTARCCPGLEAVGGFCVRQVSGCKGEGESISVTESPLDCCEGLILMAPKEEGTLGISGYCSEKCGNGVCDQATESSYNCGLDCTGIDLDFSYGECDEDPYDASNLGVKDPEWLADGRLSVEAIVSINCGEGIEGSSYRKNEGQITLVYDSPACEICANCMCAHRLTYVFTGLERKDYQFELERKAPVGTVYGKVGIYTGNCMPGPDSTPCVPGDIQTQVYITTPSDQYDESLLVALVRTDEQGIFEAELPVGDYSLFVHDGDFAEYGDGDTGPEVCDVWECPEQGCVCSPFTVEEGERTEANANIDHAAW